MQSISHLRHLGDYFISGQTWLIHESIDDDNLPPALAKMGQMFEVTGGGHYDALAIEVCRYPEISLSLLDDRVTMQITEADLFGSRAASSVVFLEGQLLTALRFWPAHGAYNFLFDR